MTGGMPGVARRMREAALRWLDSLDDARRSAAVASFEDERARTDWTYLPGERSGVALAEMTQAQAKAALRLVASGLSRHAYAQVMAIMALEDVLDEVEGGEKGRHRGGYWIALFGEPSADGPWSWRFEGHHVSVNHTVVDGEIVRGRPTFLGANPARVEYGGLSVLEPLHAEEQLAFDLLHALPAVQRGWAVVFDAAPHDILTTWAPRVDDYELGEEGIPLGELIGEAAELAGRLMGLYLDRVPPAIAEDHRKRLSVEEVRFAWAGGDQPGIPHYYRLQGPRLLVELDNTRGNANHVHSVVRDPQGDFGYDVLRAHVAADHSSLHG